MLLNNNIEIDSDDSSYDYYFASKDVDNTNSTNHNLGIECCIVTSEKTRTRCFMLHGDNDDRLISLSRLIACYE